MNQNKVIIYTDGSCDVNPGGNGGYAAIIFDNNKPIKLSGYEPNTTNQRMEMLAVISSLNYFKEKKSITLFTDSAYVCNGYNQKWYNNWKRNGWKNSKGEDVANKDLWLRIIEAVEFHDVKMIHVKGHADNIFNNECDIMAKDIVSFYKKIDKIMDKYIE